MVRFQILLKRVDVMSEQNVSSLDGIVQDVRQDSTGREFGDVMPNGALSMTRAIAWLDFHAKNLEFGYLKAGSAQVTVHCTRGQSRSPAIVLAWLIKFHQLSSDHLEWAEATVQEMNLQKGNSQTLHPLVNFKVALEMLPSGCP